MNLAGVVMVMPRAVLVVMVLMLVTVFVGAVVWFVRMAADFHATAVDSASAFFAHKSVWCSKSQAAFGNRLSREPPR
jgi:hypothetical protein